MTDKWTPFMFGDSKTLARDGDPDTSKMGAEHVATGDNLKRAQEYAFQAVSDFPGRTLMEIAHLRHETDPRKIGRRLVELERQGRITRGEPRRCSVTGRMAAVWSVKGGAS